MTTPLRPVDNLMMAMARLKGQAPNTFAEMKDALFALYGVRSGECVQAPPDGVLKAQGRALQVKEFLDLVETCTEDANALQTKLRAKEKT
jgi:hypothetical protein